MTEQFSIGRRSVSPKPFAFRHPQPFPRFHISTRYLLFRILLLSVSTTERSIEMIFLTLGRLSGGNAWTFAFSHFMKHIREFHKTSPDLFSRSQGKILLSKLCYGRRNILLCLIHCQHNEILLPCPWLNVRRLTSGTT